MIKPDKKLAQAALRSGLTYSLGLMLGNVVIVLLFRSLDSDYYRDTLPAITIYVGVVVALLVIAFGSFIGGAIGSLGLPRPDNTWRTAVRYAWRSGLALGLSIGLVMYPLAGVILFFSFYTIVETSDFKFDLIFAGFGLLMGAFVGLLLGALTVWRRGVRWVALAGALGFGLGGLVLGFSLRRFLLSMTLGDFRSGSDGWALFGLLFFGFAGGAAWGVVYTLLRDHPDILRRQAAHSKKRRPIRWGIVAVIAVLLLYFLDPFVEAAIDVVTPRQATLDNQLNATITGTHWADETILAEDLPEDAADSALDVNNSGAMALVWAQEGDVYLMVGQAGHWQPPVNVSGSATSVARPQVALDDSGTAHVVWQEAGAGIWSSRCTAVTCTPPTVISQTAVCTSAAVATGEEPTLALAANGDLLAVWRQGEQLLFRAWSVAGQETGAADCVPVGSGGQPRLAAGTDGRFHLVYNSSVDGAGTIYTTTFDGAAWSAPTDVGNGAQPEMMVDRQGQSRIAWCSDDARVQVASAQGAEAAFAPACQSRPALAQDETGQLHVVWYGTEVTTVNGSIQPQTLLYEAAQLNGQWTEPAIIAQTDRLAQPSIAPDGQGNLHLAWIGGAAGDGRLQYTTYTPYNCHDYPLSAIGQVVYETGRNPAYRSPEDIIPYCQNQYQRLSYAPSAEAAFSDWPATPNGAFDDMAALVKTAEYEVLFSTMWYGKDKNQDSPGAVLAQAIADLYRQLQEHPERYPRGLTVRILLGNPPEMELGSLMGQMWYVLNDLQAAGVDKLVDDTLGWRLEVANFDGAFPHSHTKMLVIDGKTVLVAGYNMQYEHYPADHPSGEGIGRLDLGIQVTGPVAQSAHRVYDDLWAGAEQKVCPDYRPDNPFWPVTCTTETAVADHAPETTRFYVPENGRSTAFSLYRSKAHDEADQAVANSIAQAQHSVDAMQVMFTMQMVCDLNLIIDVCGFQQAPGYLQGLVQAAENGAFIRLIVKPKPTDGIESFIAIRIFLNELTRRGLRGQVEIRLFNDEVHYKTTLVDNEFLVVGSQNFHYSAFGTGTGLTEYNLGVTDDQAIRDYQRLFAAQWERATPLMLDEN